MKLLALKLKNFKGIKEFEFVANGESIDIFGENATGKTTLFDSLSWLLFDKDSQNRKDFGIKTVDASGREIHRLEHEVEGRFLVDGNDVTLRKAFKEKWTRSRGQATEKFSGHTTDYFVDEVPCKKGEYESIVAKLADEKVFKLLTNPLFFNEQLSWQERRDAVINVCGDITDAEVCESGARIGEDKGLLDLLNILNAGKSIEDLKKTAAAKQREINNELKNIPVRISELQNSLKEVPPNDEALKIEIDSVIVKQNEKREKIALLENGGAVTELTLQISKIDTEIQQNLNTLNADTNKRRDLLRKDISDLEIKLSNINHEVYTANSRVKQIEQEITSNDSKLEKLRTQGMAEIAKEFPKAESDCTCAFCGQQLPRETIEANQQKLANELEKFNLGKAEKLTDINEKGKSLTVENEALKKKMAETAEQAATNESLYKEKQEQLTSLKEQFSQFQEITTSPVIETLKAKQDDLRCKIMNEKDSTVEQVALIKSEINGLSDRQSELNQQLAAITQSKKTRERIADLEKQQTTLAQEYESLTRQIYLTEQFTKRKIDMLQEKINSKFKLARFKMFEENISNEGINECCETTLDGVPYKDLNNAAKINIGLDIIRTLSAYYNFNAPIFIDNAEAVTKLIDMGATQIIRLVVSEQDKSLRVASKQIELKEAI